MATITMAHRMGLKYVDIIARSLRAVGAMALASLCHWPHHHSYAWLMAQRRHVAIFSPKSKTVDATIHSDNIQPWYLFLLTH
jgi:hypothetical protein